MVALALLAADIPCLNVKNHGKPFYDLLTQTHMAAIIMVEHRV